MKAIIAMLPQLIAELKRLGIAERCYFHVSDEPSLEALDSYSSAAEFLKPFVEDRVPEDLNLPQ